MLEKKPPMTFTMGNKGEAQWPNRIWSLILFHCTHRIASIRGTNLIELENKRCVLSVDLVPNVSLCVCCLLFSNCFAWCVRTKGNRNWSTMHIPFRMHRMGKQQQLSHTFTVNILHANDLITKQNIFYVQFIANSKCMCSIEHTNEKLFNDQISAIKAILKFKSQLIIWCVCFFHKLFDFFSCLSLLFKSEECCISAVCKMSQRHTKYLLWFCNANVRNLFFCLFGGIPWQHQKPNWLDQKPQSTTKLKRALIQNAPFNYVCFCFLGFFFLQSDAV